MRLIFGFNEACHHALSDLGSWQPSPSMRFAMLAIICDIKRDIILGMA